MALTSCICFLPFQESRNVENLINQMAVPAVQGAQSDPVENNIAEPIEGDVETEESPQLGAVSSLLPDTCSYIIFIGSISKGRAPLGRPTPH